MSNRQRYSDMKIIQLACLKIFIAGILSGFILASTSYAADQRYGRHTLGSAPDVYRIELRNLTQFEVMHTGDPDSSGELHKVNIELYAGPYKYASRDQHHGFDEYGMNFQTPSTRKRGNNAYHSINKGEVISYGGRRKPQEQRNLWVHIKKDGSWLGGLQIKTRELDCAKQKVCRRGNDGTFYFNFRIPYFTSPPPTTCGPSNTFPLATAFEFPRKPRSLDIIDLQSYGSSGEAWGNLKRRGEDRGAILKPINGEICIASTRLSAAQKLKQQQSRSSGTTSQSQRNRKIQKAF